MSKTLAEEIKDLSQDDSVMWAVGVLGDKGINGVMYDKIMAIWRQSQATS